MKKYTEGPWRNEGTQIYSGPYLIADTDIDRSYPDINETPSEIDFKNAQLIAAAPELLEALQLYLTDCDVERLEYNDDTYTLARQAIAKALGKEE